MGWCSGTEIFDVVAKHITKKTLNREELLEELVEVMYSHDWDCEHDSAYFKNPLVKKVFKKMNPYLYETD